MRGRDKRKSEQGIDWREGGREGRSTYLGHVPGMHQIKRRRQINLLREQGSAHHVVGPV